MCKHLHVWHLRTSWTDYSDETRSTSPSIQYLLCYSTRSSIKLDAYSHCVTCTISWRVDGSVHACIHAYQQLISPGLHVTCHWCTCQSLHCNKPHFFEVEWVWVYKSLHEWRKCTHVHTWIAALVQRISLANDISTLHMSIRVLLQAAFLWSHVNQGIAIGGISLKL